MWSKGRLKSQAVRSPLLPDGLSKRATSFDRQLQRSDLGLRLWLIDKCDPVVWPRNWPTVQGHTGAVVGPMPQARPTPSFRLTDKPGTYGISFNVAAHGIEVFVALNRERLKSPLVKWSGP